MRLTRRTLFLLLLMAFIGGAYLLLDSLVTRISPRNMTVSAMGETSYRIKMYVDLHGSLPSDFSILPVRSGYMNKTTDYWGRTLTYAPTESRFTLTSLGRDGRDGGNGDDADIVRRYRVEKGDVSEEYQPASSN